MGKLKNFVNRLTFGDRVSDAADVPRSGTGLFWFVLKNHYLMLIVLNLLFVLCSLPIVTIPAAYSGLVAVLMKWTRRNPDVEVFATFFSEFRAHFFGKLGVWAITTVAPLSLAAYTYFFFANDLAFYAVLLVGVIFALLVQSYFFAQTVMLEIKVGAALKNAFLLLAVEWKITLRLLCTVGLLAVVCLFATTYAIPFAVLCLFSLVALSVTTETAYAIETRLAK